MSKPCAMKLNIFALTQGTFLVLSMCSVRSLVGSFLVPHPSSPTLSSSSGFRCSSLQRSSAWGKLSWASRDRPRRQSRRASMSAADHRGAEGVDASGVRSHDMVGEGGGARGTNKSTEGWGVRSDIDGVGPWRMGAKGEVLVEKVFNEMGGGVETAGGGESVGMTTADPLKTSASGSAGDMAMSGSGAADVAIRESGEAEITAGGVRRGEFLRALLGLVAAPWIGSAMMGGGVPAADAAMLDRTRLGTPILTESVLLDLLPIEGSRADTLREVQDEIEKATILRTLYRRVNTTAPPGSVVEQLTVPPSVWDRVQSVAEEALETLVERRAELEPVFREVDSAETQIRRAEYSESVFASIKEALKRMAQGAVSQRPPVVLAAQEDALLGLGRIGELFVSSFPFEITAGDSYDSIPRLLGRATVEMTVRREPEDPRGKAKILGNITVVVDGYSCPVTAGNFMDLTLRGFYNELPIRFDSVPVQAQVGSENNETINTVVTGSYREGFVDPATGTLRRLPLEILRVAKRGNVPVYGAARNTKVFTKAPAVQTFRIPGTIAMCHPPLDGNGGSSEFFWVQDQELEKDGYLMNQRVEALDSRYSIFGYVVGNRRLLGRLKDGDVIEKMAVTYGEDNLLRPKSASFTDLFLNGGSEDDG